MSTENKDLRAALVAAQREMVAADKASRNNHGGFDYASKEEIAATAKQILGAHGLAFSLRGPVEMGDHCARWMGVLTHESGQQEEWSVWWMVDYDRKGMTLEQRLGAAQSYAYKNEALVLLNIPRELPGQRIDAESARQVTRPPARKQSRKAELMGRAKINRENAAEVMRYLGANYALPDNADDAAKIAALEAFDARHGLHNLIDAAAEWAARQDSSDA